MADPPSYGQVMKTEEAGAPYPPSVPPGYPMANQLYPPTAPVYTTPQSGVAVYPPPTQGGYIPPPPQQGPYPPPQQAGYPPPGAYPPPQGQYPQPGYGPPPGGVPQQPQVFIY